VTEIAGWVSTSLAELAAKPDLPLVSIHLDQLLTERYRPEQALEIGFERFAETVNLVGADTSVIMVKLALPLPHLKRFAREYPNPEEWQSAVDPSEPPSLYLYRRTLCLEPPEGEQYTADIPALRVPVPLGYARAAYTCYRSAEAMSRGWTDDYARTIWINHYVTNT
jgi:hypothetical protein